jgi:thiol-disulfide isomerase/thioredoxin
MRNYLELAIIFAGLTLQLKAQSAQQAQPTAQFAQATPWPARFTPAAARPTQAPITPVQPTTRTISGQVTSQENGSPLEGVAVWAKGDTLPSGTMADGMYYLPICDKDSILVVSLDGFQPQEIRLTAASDYNVVLRKVQTPPAPPASAPAPPAPSASRVLPPFNPIGNWRAVFQLKPGVEVPITFDIRTSAADTLKAYFHNAEERFEGGWIRQTSDSLFIFLDQFDNELAFRIADSGLTGVLKKQDGTGTPLPVTAQAGVNYRFRDEGIKPAGDISGTYDITFHSENGKEEKAVGLFRQQGNTLRATFLRVTGDSRYLEGIVEGDHFYLSSYIGGAAPGYYTGSFTTDGQLEGNVVGAHGGQAFTGIHNEKAALPDAYTLTYLKPGYSSFDFSFPDANGHPITLQATKFRNKVVIVTIGGTWCPNCVDETSFLAPWYAANKSRGIEIVSIQYERQTDTAFVHKVLSRQREKYNIGYTQVFGGLADKQGVANSLPSLNAFLAFPTTIFIDKKGKVAKIHTGYSGPATGIYYQQFEKEFNDEVDELVKQ